MTRAEATDLLYLINRLWHRTSPVHPDDVAAAMVVLADVDFQTAVAAVAELGAESDRDYPPSLPAIAGATTRKPKPVPPYYAPYVPELEDPGPSDPEDVAESFAEARARLRLVRNRKEAS